MAKKKTLIIKRGPKTELEKELDKQTHREPPFIKEENDPDFWKRMEERVKGYAKFTEENAPKKTGDKKGK